MCLSFLLWLERDKPSVASGRLRESMGGLESCTTRLTNGNTSLSPSGARVQDQVQRTGQPGSPGAVPTARRAPLLSLGEERPGASPSVVAAQPGPTRPARPPPIPAGAPRPPRSRPPRARAPHPAYFLGVHGQGLSPLGPKPRRRAVGDGEGGPTGQDRYPRPPLSWAAA